MIEFELKYKLTNVPEVLKNFELVKIENQSDVYYDTPQYLLLEAGNFLRVRNNLKIDFKFDLGDATHLYCRETSFKVAEIDKKNNELNQILKSIGFPASMNYATLEDFIAKNDLLELARVDKVRTIYKLGDDCTLCIDDVKNLGLFLEAEVMINQDIISPNEVISIKESVVRRLKNAEIIDETDETFNAGYVELYLLTHNPKVYALGKFNI